MKKICLFFSVLCINNAFASAYTSDIPNGCVLDEMRMFAVYVANSYTCDAGYFLPASSDTCQPCPDGYTCNGGTFEAKINEAQGLARVSNQIEADAINACDINFPTRMYAVFVPNETITVNFKNGDTIETIACTYDTEFTLPEPPTRVGYIFTGWKVKNE